MDRPGELVAGVAAWVAGMVVGIICAIVAVVLVPQVGLFGDTNSTGERLVGVVAGLACGPAVVAGPLRIGARRRDWSAIVVAGIIAVAISAGVLVAAS